MGYHSCITVLKSAFCPKQPGVIMVVKNRYLGEEENFDSYTCEKNEEKEKRREYSRLGKKTGHLVCVEREFILNITIWLASMPLKGFPDSSRSEKSS